MKIPLLKFSSPVQKLIYIILIILCCTSWIPAPFALIMGFLSSIFIGNPLKIGKLINLLLKISIVGLGFSINLKDALIIGKEGFFLTVISISLVFFFGYMIGKLFKLDTVLIHLISTGTAICGGSAIAAVGPAINAKQDEMSVSLATIFFLNTIGLFLFPFIGHLIGMDEHKFGLWAAIAIHDTSSVVGATSTFGNIALETATTVKLVRALWIIPLVIISVFAFRNKNTHSKISYPWFILFFFIAIIINTYIPQVSLINHDIAKISKTGMVVTLFLIGSEISFSKIKQVGWKTLVLGIILWIIISILSFIGIEYL